MAVEKANPPIKKKVPCETCQMIGHSTIECPNIPVYQETTPAEMNALNNFRGPQNSYGNSYQSNWKSPPQHIYTKEGSQQLQPQQYQPPQNNQYLPPPP